MWCMGMGMPLMHGSLPPKPRSLLSSAEAWATDASFASSSILSVTMQALAPQILPVDWRICLLPVAI